MEINAHGRKDQGRVTADAKGNPAGAEEELYEYWFASLPGITPLRKRELRMAYPSARSIYYIEETGKNAVPDEAGAKDPARLSKQEYEKLRASRNEEKLRRGYDRMQKAGIRLCTIFDPRYPDRLRTIYCPPYALFYLGELPPKGRFSVSVVGARQCSHYGAAVAREIGRTCAQKGVPVISGMADGIDAISQGSAILAGGASYAVLGCGVDICYPSDNRDLYRRLLETGGLLSEYPPGVAPVAWHFPARNRIISALSDITIVVEAREKSGSLITADHALEQGKTVYAVPGPVTSVQSRGCNQLIRQGAAVFLSMEETLAECGVCPECAGAEEEKNRIKLETKEELVYSCLNLMPQTVDAIQKKTHLEIGELLTVLMSLELKGLAQTASKHHYVRTNGVSAAVP